MDAKQERRYEKFYIRLEELGEQADPRKIVSCSSCGESYPLLISKKLTGDKCPECYAEIHFGKIPTDSANLRVSGGRGTSDPDPGFENAVRTLEDFSDE